MLVRRQVARLLADYYAQPSNRVVGSVLSEGPIDFRSLWGEWHYRRICARLYAKQEGRWLTSVELMRPYYSQVVANFVAAQADQDDAKKQGFDIVEMGGGRGTNASIVLSHLQKVHPDVYNRVNTYTMIDASPSLLELQQESMRASEHYDKMKFELKDLIDVAEDKVPFLSQSDTPTVVLACELLDNLPHDKVRVKAGRLLEQGEIVGTGATENENAKALEEIFVPLKDPLLSRAVKLVPAYTRASLIAWIPTVAFGILDRLHESRPNSSLMLADFDWLPPPELSNEGDEENRTSLWAPGEPIVTDMEGMDHACYLQSPEHCDILFPTDFPKLASYVKKSWKLTDKGDSLYKVDVHKQSDFLQLYGPSEVQATQSWLTGFTPMLHDFANCSALTVTRRDSLSENDMAKYTKRKGEYGSQ